MNALAAVATPQELPLEDQLAEQLCAAAAGYLEAKQVEGLRRAYAFGAQCHQGQFRVSGEPYICHPVSVALILAGMRMDYYGLMAAILHDVIEDTPVTKEQLAEEFGVEVAELVDGVSKLTQLDGKSKMEAQAENVRKMFLAMVKDLRVIMVKLADRLHNMRTLAGMSPERRRRIARETLEIYAPLANRLGINQIRLELEDLGFASLYPLRHRALEQAVRKARGNRKEVVEQIRSALEAKLQEGGLHCEVLGREKHLLSLYQKMRGKRLTMHDVFDVYAFRIITGSVDECYRALGVVHNLYKPVPGRFKDYIALPKPNGYQSLHTVLAGPFDLPMEIQIRTRDMHCVAETGIASHWLYKSEDEQARVHEWLRELLEIQKNAGNSLEFLDNLKVDLFQQEVFVFTPKGKVVKLPRGSTVVDFAYAVHTDVGNHCMAGRIDRRPAPLQTVLENGQTVEIITSSWVRPNPQWLNCVVTAKARSAVRANLRSFQAQEAVDLGRRLLEKELAALGTSLVDISAEQLKVALKGFQLPNLDALLEDIGLGNRLPLLVAQRVLHGQGGAAAEGESGGGRAARAPLLIQGTEGMVVSLAKCCRPILGDPIIGFFSPGKGIVVHRMDCNNATEARKKKRSSWLEVAWDKTVSKEFSAEIRLELVNQRGTLAEVAATISRMGCNIENVAMVNQDAQTSTDFITLAVRDRVHLANVMRALRKLPVVLRIARAKT
jgi:GTP pyrophosphokinase/guanosine-3',5'-bis(diphosphate) 3'-pyrophosphohydrolase